MRKIKSLTIAAIALSLALSLTACQGADVIGSNAKASFETLTKKVAPETASQQENSWSITSPGGEQFLWSKDLAGSLDAAIEFDAAPFISAGLDASKLPTDIFTYDQASNKIKVATELGTPAKATKADITAVDSFKLLVDTKREAIGYHAKLDHYGVALGSGNMFEWAKDMSTNDKDMVFVLNPEPFIAAGVDTNKLQDWVFAKVEVMDENNKPIQVDKFLKPYDLGQ